MSPQYQDPLRIGHETLERDFRESQSPRHPDPRRYDEPTPYAEGQFWQGPDRIRHTGPYRTAMGYGGSPVDEHGVSMIPAHSSSAWATESGARQRRFRTGPKGYQRSDERMVEDICEQLTQRFDIDCSDVTIHVREGKATLTGVVPERRMKHEIEDIVAECAGVHDVDNKIHVKRAL